MMRKLILSSFVVLQASVGFGQTAEELVRPSDMPGKIQILNVRGGGTGCPQFSENSWSISPDLEAVTVFFDDFYATLDSGFKSCSYALNLYVPEGFSVSPTSVEHVGYYNVSDVGTKARNTARFQIQGSAGERFGAINYITEIHNPGRRTGTVDGYPVYCYASNGIARFGTGKPVACENTLDVIDKFIVVSEVWTTCGTQTRNMIVSLTNSVQKNFGTRSPYNANPTLGLDFDDLSISTVYRQPLGERFYWNVKSCAPPTPY